MKMKNFNFLIVLLLFLSACDKSSISSVPICCANDPIVATIGAGTIAIPNIFTPDFDAFNDRLIVLGDSGIQVVELFEISTTDGQVLFEATQFLVNSIDFAWDGQFEGKPFGQGMVNIRVVATSVDGVTESVEGQVCCFPCDSDDGREPAFDAVMNCRYNNQFSQAENAFIPIDQSRLDCFE